MLSVKTIEQLKVVGQNLGITDMNSKELFVLAHSEFLKTNKEDLKKVHKEFREQVKAMFPSVSIQRGVLRVISVAYKYSELQAITYLDRLNYDNVKSVVSLLSYINKNKPEELKAVRNKLSRVKFKEDVVDYNNRMIDKLHELTAEYRVVETADGETVALTGASIVKKVEENIDKLTPEQVQELLAVLSAKAAENIELEVA